MAEEQENDIWKRLLLAVGAGLGRAADTFTPETPTSEATDAFTALLRKAPEPEARRYEPPPDPEADRRVPALPDDAVRVPAMPMAAPRPTPAITPIDTAERRVAALAPATAPTARKPDPRPRAAKRRRFVAGAPTSAELMAWDDMLRRRGNGG